MRSPSDLKIAEVVAGRKAQALKETPGAISVRNSTAEVRPTHNLDSVGTSQRYAGDEGSFAYFARKVEDITQLKNALVWAYVELKAQSILQSLEEE